MTIPSGIPHSFNMLVFNGHLAPTVGFKIINCILYGSASDINPAKVCTADSGRFTHQNGVVGILMRFLGWNQLLGRVVMRCFV